MSSEVVDLREGIFAESAGSTVLVGQRQDATGKVRFPPQTEPGWSDIELSREGALFSWSTVWMPAAGMTPPYTVGYVRLQDGPLVFTLLSVPDGLELRAGMPVRLAVGTGWLASTDEGAEVRAYRFAVRGGER